MQHVKIAFLAVERHTTYHVLEHFLIKQAKKLLGADEKQLGVSERLTAGAMAGVASQTSIYPLEVMVLH